MMSRVCYSISVWGTNLNLSDKIRLNTGIFRGIQFHRRDFRNLLSNREICERTGLRSFDSIRFMADATLLHKIVTLNSSTSLAIRLIQQTTSNGRFPNRLIFFNCSTRNISRHSFIKGILDHLVPTCSSRSPSLVSSLISESLLYKGLLLYQKTIELWWFYWLGKSLMGFHTRSIHTHTLQTSALFFLTKCITAACVHLTCHTILVHIHNKQVGMNLIHLQFNLVPPFSKMYFYTISSYSNNSLMRNI